MIALIVEQVYQYFPNFHGQTCSMKISKESHRKKNKNEKAVD
jgi:hypothetical protein